MKTLKKLAFKKQENETEIVFKKDIDFLYKYTIIISISKQTKKVLVLKEIDGEKGKHPVAVDYKTIKAIKTEILKLKLKQLITIFKLKNK